MKSFSANTKEAYYAFKLNVLFHYIKIFLVVVFIIFEELAWKRLGQPAYEAIKSLKVMDKFKDWIADIDHRYMLLAIFLVPFMLMEVSSIFAGKALFSGAIVTGIGLYTIKLLLTAPVVIIFNSGKKILVSFWVVKYGYGTILNLKRSNTFRSVKKYTVKITESFETFKSDYLNTTDGDFSESIKKMYSDIKKV